MPAVAAPGPGPGLERLGRPELAPVVDELARRFGDGDVPVALSLRGLSMAERQGLADLLGLDRLPPATSRVQVGRLVAVLGVGSVNALRHLVEALRGPLPDRRAERTAARTERDGLWSWLEAEATAVPLLARPTAVPGASAPLVEDVEGVWRRAPDAIAPSPSSVPERASVWVVEDEEGLRWKARGAIAAHPPTVSMAAKAWVERARAQGPRGGVDTHRRRLERALSILRALPADNVALAAFASDLVGDPHALDRGRRVAALVLDAVALATGAPLPTSAESARHLWESVGVAPDPLSSTVLALGLPGEGAPEPLARWLDAARHGGEPVVLTLAQLRRWPLPPLPPSAVAYVVENPSLVAEAARMGWTGRPPLVCSSGRPTVAVVTLLRQLGAAGAQLRQHADFDAAGLSITAWLAERAGTAPWRMTAADYRVGTAGRQAPAGSQCVAVAATPWDPGLATEVIRTGLPLFEEECRADLLDAMCADVAR